MWSCGSPLRNAAGQRFFSDPMQCLEAPFEAFQSAGNATQASDSS
jgi:hypothetical protein